MSFHTLNRLAVLDGAAIGVIIGGVFAIVAVLWYFFGPRKRIAAEVTSSGVQTIRITVKGG